MSAQSAVSFAIMAANSCGELPSGSALVNVRERVAELSEIYPEKMSGDPQWNNLREYFCPGCKTLLEVEAVPPGYPVIHDFVPDLEGFYEEWLGRELP